MNVQLLAENLTQNEARILGLIQNIGPEQAHWKPTEQDWSVVEVINHLYDEERLDFRVRLDMILCGSVAGWPPIHPSAWVVERRYNERELALSVRNFRAERRASLLWLGTLVDPDWERVYQAPFGPIRAGEMAAAWMAHDLLHMRQLVELHWAWVTRQTQPYSVRYAGDW